MVAPTLQSSSADGVKWDLTDLYKGDDDPQIQSDLSAALQRAQAFEDIERAISEAVPALKTPLIPKNVPWFTVRPDDFPNPEIAREILAAYGEDRGDGTKRLYRFPVVFFGTKYWGGLVAWLRQRVLADQKISPSDMELLTVTDDPREAAACVVRAHR